MGNKHTNEIKEFFSIISNVDKLNEYAAAAGGAVGNNSGKFADYTRPSKASTAQNTKSLSADNAGGIPPNQQQSTGNEDENGSFVRIAKMFASSPANITTLNSALERVDAGKSLPIQLAELLSNTIVKKVLDVLVKDESLFQRFKAALAGSSVKSAPVPATTESFDPKKMSNYDKETLMILKPLIIESQIAANKLNELNKKYLKEAQTGQVDPKIRQLGMAMTGNDPAMQSQLLHGLTVLATGGATRAASDATARPALIMMLANLLKYISENPSLYGMIKQILGIKEPPQQQQQSQQQTAATQPQQQPAQAGAQPAQDGGDNQQA